MTRKVLVTGANGQVGTALRESAPPGFECHAVDRSLLDITNRAVVRDAVDTLRPDLIINAAAYTAVDKAEVESNLAYLVNRDAVAYLAEAAARSKARIIHLSTDYVFDGMKSSPYQPEDPAHPINVYGQSKLGGEAMALDRTEGQALVVRTAWVYSAVGHNFVRSILRLLHDRTELRVVDDQVGSPTSASELAAAIWKLAKVDVRGVQHWTNSGVASWYDFACAIAELASPSGVVRARVVPICSAEYKVAAPRPAYTVLEKSRSWRLLGAADHWKVPLAHVVRSLCQSGVMSQ